MGITKLERELEQIQKKRIRINSLPYGGEVTAYQARQLRVLELRESEIYSELELLKEAA
jgi:hypothetical protein